MASPEPDLAFSASVSEIYDDLLVPLIFEGYAEDLTRRLQGMESGSVLEVAAGTGVVTRRLASTLPPAVAITASDLSQAMIDRAMRIGTERAVEWQQADVMSMPFAPASFDVVVCQFGVMFFDPKRDAFAEVRRVLRPGGRFVFSVWDGFDRNEFVEVVARSLERTFPDDPPTFIERVPHGYHDPEQIVADLRAGGFAAQPSIERVEYVSRAANAHDVATAYCMGTPIRAELERRRPGGLAEVVALATAALEARFGSRDLEGRISAQVVDVTK